MSAGVSRASAQHRLGFGEPATAAAWPSFIETQFPVSLLSKESYKERKANYSQTLTGLGKWWGRKPLILVRAVILGLLLPASGDPRKDRETFLALLTMDAEGLRRRKSKTIPLPELYRRLDAAERRAYFAAGAAGGVRLKKGATAEQRRELQMLVFDRLSYDEKLAYCDRPEQIDGPSPAAWRAVNAHLGTAAAGLPELVGELGRRRFGRVPRVGDAFCGGGSVPFEAARIGCDAYGSDLNPVAALLTWGALHLVGGGPETAAEVRAAQERAYRAVDRQITEWRIEHDAAGWRADAFLYCTETRCPQCGWLVPLAPSWVIGQKTRTVAELEPQPDRRRFAIRIRSGAAPAAMAAARAGTTRQSRLICPNAGCAASIPLSAVRGDRRGEDGRGYGLRRWESGDLAPRPDDVFGERLYCVRWRLPRLADLLWAEQRRDPHASPLPEWVSLAQAIEALSAFLDAGGRRELAGLRKRDWGAEDAELDAARRDLAAVRADSAAGDPPSLRRRVRDLEAARKRREAAVAALAATVPAALYREVGGDDQEREERALSLLRERFAEWQRRGFLPGRAIVPGYNTTQPIRERGWTHWHHLFTPRQLLISGLLLKQVETAPMMQERAAMLLGVARCANWNSKLSMWDSGATKELVNQAFYNQALNTLDSFGVKGLSAIDKAWFVRTPSCLIAGSGAITAADAREQKVTADLWVTDPPYADAINYHELSEMFLAWHGQLLTGLFPRWYADSKRALAVQGADSDFRRSMVDCYRNLSQSMPEHGMQVVMFTHQDPAVWADLALILWASGLRVTAAWTIATETESALKEGNYVQGTVLMVLRKQTAEDTAFLDEVVPEVETEVQRQLASMHDLEDRDAPNFSDADYQLAAYAAALRVLTNYRAIEDVDVSYELSRERRRGDANPLAGIIEDAVRTASNFLVPAGLPPQVWRGLRPDEKFYLKGLEVESHGDFRAGVYQEFARGFGVADYGRLLHADQANRTRLKTASELQRADLAGAGLLRHALYAVYRAAATGEVTESLTWLHFEVADYWPQRAALAAILRSLAALPIDHWRTDAAAARLLAGAVENDHV